MTSKRVYDLCVIGGGPAGWAGAVRAWDLGRSVCLVERREGLGGAAVWGGAMGKHVMQVHHTGPRQPIPSRATHVRATLTCVGSSCVDAGGGQGVAQSKATLSRRGSGGSCSEGGLERMGGGAATDSVVHNRPCAASRGAALQPRPDPPLQPPGAEAQRKEWDNPALEGRGVVPLAECHHAFAVQ